MMLFCDCKTDEERSNFFLSGRAVETGVVAPAISNFLAMAYHKCVQLKKENEELRASLEAAETELAELRSSMEFRTSLIGRTEAERDALRTRITEMEKQEPVGTLHDDGYFVWRKTAPYESNYAGWKTALYALPGAKGEEK